MRKFLLLTMIGVLLPMISKAQVHDEEKYLQWRSMETGPLEFAPKLYYWLFHNNYAHHEWEWEWHGFKSGFFLHLKENKSDAKPLIPKRTLAQLLICGRRNRQILRRRTSSISWNRKHSLPLTAE